MTDIYANHEEVEAGLKMRELGLPAPVTGYIDSNGNPLDSDGNIHNWKYLRVRGNPGDIVIQQLNGRVGMIPACGIGQWQLVPGRKVLTSGNINGTEYTTTATDIWWAGCI